MDPKILERFNLTKNESIVYLTLLKLGECKVSNIIKESNFRSGKIYQVLDSLTNKGIISCVDKNNVKYFYPYDPRKILEYIKLRKNALEQEESNFLQYLPQLKSIYDEKKDLCETKVYEGVEGVRSALFLLLEKTKKNSNILIYGANDDSQRDVVLLWRKYDEICQEKNIITKVIMSSMSEEGRASRKTKKNKYKSYKFLSGKDVSNFMIGGNVVLLIDFDKPNCIFIENTKHSEQFTKLFEVLWGVSKKL